MLFPHFPNAKVLFVELELNTYYITVLIYYTKKLNTHISALHYALRDKEYFRSISVDKICILCTTHSVHDRIPPPPPLDRYILCIATFASKIKLKERISITQLRMIINRSNSLLTACSLYAKYQDIWYNFHSHLSVIIGVSAIPRSQPLTQLYC